MGGGDRAAAGRRIAAAQMAPILLLIEFLDELVFGAGEAAWPLIRDDLALSYDQIGLLLGIPGRRAPEN